MHMLLKYAFRFACDAIGLKRGGSWGYMYAHHGVWHRQLVKLYMYVYTSKHCTNDTQKIAR